MVFFHSYTIWGVWMDANFNPLSSTSETPLPTGTNDSGTSGTGNNIDIPPYGVPYYKYLLTWVYGILFMSDAYNSIIQNIISVYKLKSTDRVKAPW